jgi:hypothetical protein
MIIKNTRVSYLPARSLTWERGKRRLLPSFSQVRALMAAHRLVSYWPGVNTIYIHVYKFDNIFEYGYDILNIDSSRSLQVVLQSN